MKLRDLKNNEFDVLISNPTGKVANEFYKIMSEMPQEVSPKIQEYSLIVSKYLEMKDGESMEQASLRALQKAVVAGDVNKEELSEIMNVKQLSIDEKILRNNCYIQCLRAIVDLKNVTNEQAYLLQTKYNSDFWQNQDLVSIKVEVDRFHNIIK